MYVKFPRGLHQVQCRRNGACVFPLVAGCVSEVFLRNFAELGAFELLADKTSFIRTTGRCYLLAVTSAVTSALRSAR